MSEEPKMPAVWSLTYQKAKAALDSAGIPYQVSFAQNQAIPEGDRLLPELFLSAGKEALLTVSSGPPVMPNRD
jgi:hypothetical protein